MFGLSRTKTVRRLEVETDAIVQSYEGTIAALEERLTEKEQDLAAKEAKHQAILTQERRDFADKMQAQEARHSVNSHRFEVEIGRLSGENLVLRERTAELEHNWKLVSMHEWHVAGKKDVHNAGVLHQYECPHCEARLYAPEGGL